MISKENQIIAILNSNLKEFLEDGDLDVACIEFNKKVTFNKNDIKIYLERHIEQAIKYFDRYKIDCNGRHDCVGINNKGDKFIVFYCVHGKAEDVMEFDNVVDAVIALIAHNYSIFSLLKD